MANELKGITVRIDADLHAEIKKYIEENNMTMAEFITRAVEDELHPKIQEENKVEKMRTLAFQVPESLFQRIKGYLARTGMSQKNFVMGLIEEELDRDEEMRAAQAVSEAGREDPEEAETDEITDAEYENDFAGGEEAESESEAVEESSDDPIYMEENPEPEAEENLTSEADAADESEDADEYCIRLRNMIKFITAQ
jgi:hypothetical protein